MPLPTRKTMLLATDQQQSVLNTLDGNGRRSIAYTPYGHRSRENGLLSLLGFNGEPPDALTGHYHLGNGYRQFNPVLMRFNSPDSWSPFGDGGLNAYAYCGGEPRNRTDPTGHVWKIEKALRRFLGLRPIGEKAPSRAQLSKRTESLKPTTRPPHSLSQRAYSISDAPDTNSITQPERSIRKANALPNTRSNPRLNRDVKPSQRPTTVPQVGKHFPPKPSPSIDVVEDIESYTKYATFDQLYIDHGNSREILNALGNQPSTSKILRNLRITEEAIHIRFS